MAMAVSAAGLMQPNGSAATTDMCDPILLESSDGELLEVPRLPAYSSIERLEDTPGTSVPVPFAAAPLRRVLSFWEQGRLAASASTRRGCAKVAEQGQCLGSLGIEEPLRSSALLESGFPPWACSLVDLPPEEVEVLLWVVDFLGNEDLLSACLARLATCFLELEQAPPETSARALRHLIERRPGYLPVHAWPAAVDALITRAPSGDEDVARVLAGLLKSADWQVRAAAKHALQCYAWRGHEPTLSHILALLTYLTPCVRKVAAEVVEVVAPRAHPETIEALLAVIRDDSDSEVRRLATRAIATVVEPGDERAIAALLDVRADNGGEILADVAEALSHVACQGDARVIARLLELFDEERWWTRLAALRALAIVAGPADGKAVEQLLELGPSGKWQVRHEEALALLGVSLAPDSEPLDPEDICARAAALQALCEELAGEVRAPQA